MAMVVRIIGNCSNTFSKHNDATVAHVMENSTSTLAVKGANGTVIAQYYAHTVAGWTSAEE